MSSVSLFLCTDQSLPPLLWPRTLCRCRPFPLPHDRPFPKSPLVPPILAPEARPRHIGRRHKYMPPIAPSRTRSTWPLASLDHDFVSFSFTLLQFVADNCSGRQVVRRLITIMQASMNLRGLFCLTRSLRQIARPHRSLSLQFPPCTVRQPLPPD